MGDQSPRIDGTPFGEYAAPAATLRPEEERGNVLIFACDGTYDDFPAGLGRLLDCS